MDDEKKLHKNFAVTEFLFQLPKPFTAKVHVFLGKSKKFGFWGYLFCSLFFTPLVGFILVLASDSKKASPPK